MGKFQIAKVLGDETSAASDNIRIFLKLYIWCEIGFMEVFVIAHNSFRFIFGMWKFMLDIIK